MTSTPTRPVDNVVITTKGLQDRNIHILDGTTVENKGKLILLKWPQGNGRTHVRKKNQSRSEGNRAHNLECSSQRHDNPV